VREGRYSPAARALRTATALLVLAAVLAAAGPLAAAAPPDEDEIFRQMKVDVFDGNWAEVLKTAEAILARFPNGPAATQASYQRARALSHLPGHETDATAAYREFIARHPDEGLLVEQAWTGIFALACDGRRQAGQGCVATLSEGLASPLPYVSTLAAIRASDTNDPALRRRALAALKATLRTQDDPDIRNEILIAILKIDPREVPAPTPPPGAPPPTQAPGAPPTLIRLSVFNKSTQRYEVRINVPVAFAQMLVDALGEDEKQELREEAKRRGIDLDDIFASIRKTGSGRFLDVDTEDSRIEVTIE
jgi:hypothetical protein